MVDIRKSDITLQELIAVARENAKVSNMLGTSAVKQMVDSRNFYLKSGVYAYGDKLCVGSNVNIVIPEEDRIPFQANLIRSLSCGAGEPLDIEIVRAAMLLRIRSLMKEGCSAIGSDKVYMIIRLLNEQLHPVMREYGSVGASGDLVPLAALAHVLQGEGEIWERDTIRDTKSVFQERGIRPLVLQEKEGLSLVNGTSVMTAIAALALYDAMYLSTAVFAGEALAIEALGGMTDHLDWFVHEVKGHRGQMRAAAVISAMLEGSRLTRNIDDLRAEIAERVAGGVYSTSIELQDPYCLRCAPHLLGPVLESLDIVGSWILTEMNSVNDNPIVNLDGKKVHHTGNFSGFYISRAMDSLKGSLFDAVSLLNAINERLLDAKLNRGLGPSLAGSRPGFNSGLKGVGLCAADVFAEICALAGPHSIHRRTTESSNQDIVSLGFGAAKTARELIGKLQIFLALHFIIVAQAVDLRCSQQKSKMAPRTREVYEQVRGICPFAAEDVPLTSQINTLSEALRNHAINIPYAAAT